jgi:hypothetical protein
MEKYKTRKEVIKPVTLSEQEFKEIWNQWSRSLSGDDDANTLVSQMCDLCWDISIIKSIISSWEKEYNVGKDFSPNQLIYHLLIDNTLYIICLKLRRLTEHGTLKKIGGRDKSVYSIHSVLDDIKTNIPNYSRKSFFMCKQVEYDIESIKRKREEFINSQHNENMQRNLRRAIAIPHDLQWEITDGYHKLWDTLCCIESTDRKESDIINIEYINKLILESDKISNEIDYITNKYIAHASTPESRADFGARRKSLELTELCELTKKCGRLVNSISQILGDAVYPFLPTATFDKWENWDKGWVSETSLLEEPWLEWGSEVERLDPYL